MVIVDNLLTLLITFWTAVDNFFNTVDNLLKTIESTQKKHKIYTKKTQNLHNLTFLGFVFFLYFSRNLLDFFIWVWYNEYVRARPSANGILYHTIRYKSIAFLKIFQNFSIVFFLCFFYGDFMKILCFLGYSFSNRPYSGFRIF